jgi:hypothetical protein
MAKKAAKETDRPSRCCMDVMVCLSALKMMGLIPQIFLSLGLQKAWSFQEGLSTVPGLFIVDTAKCLL